MEPIDVGGLRVLFPYEHIYPEQYQYMLLLKRALDARSHALLEMSSGTGKTVSILSLVIAYMLRYPDKLVRLVYCSRTIPEIDKVMGEIKNLFSYYEKAAGAAPKLLAVTLSARKNLCINELVAGARLGAQVDGKCLALTAPFVRAKRMLDPSVPSCAFYESFDIEGREFVLPNGVYNLDALKETGRQKGWCPYFFARHALSRAHVIVYSYHYLLDPKIAEIVSADLPRASMIVFDEAHNIDDVCVESMSVAMTHNRLARCTANLDTIDKMISDMRSARADELQREYEQMLRNMAEARRQRDEHAVLGNPVLPDALLDEAVPGAIRTAAHFATFLRRLLEYVKHRLRAVGSAAAVVESPAALLKDIQMRVGIERKPMRFCAERLSSLLRTLQLADLADFSPLVCLANFATLAATYSEGFALVVEPADERNPAVMHLRCLDAALAVRPVFARFQSVLITSGTLSPLGMYPRMLDFAPAVMASLGMTLARPCILPLIVAKGNDQVAISSKYEVRSDAAVIRNYGTLLLEMCQTVGDGIVVFFTSYEYMESVIGAWYEHGLIDDVLKHKLIFMETQDGAETSAALAGYVHACDIGRGAVFMSVARGKVAEGVDFNDHLGRAVLMLGIPYVYTESRVLRARLEYMRDRCGIGEADFLAFDAMRAAAQCLGRALRGKNDYGAMVLADCRFARADKRRKLPKWIQEWLKQANHSLSIEEAVQVTKAWLRAMARPIRLSEQLGVSMLSREQLAQRQANGDIDDVQEWDEGDAGDERTDATMAVL